MWKWIKRQLDKLPSSPGLLRPGKWFVQYNKTERSMLMTYDAAKNYRDIFGGTLRHISDKK